MRANSIGQSPLLMLDVVDMLNERHVPYAIIGAMAVSYYGVARSSLDADAIVFSDSKEGKIEKLKTLFIKKKLNVVTKRGNVEDPLRGIMLIEDRHGNHVDLLLGIKGMDRSAYKRIVKAEFQGISINMIGVEDLIAMKVFAGSNKDLADVEGILAVSRALIDQKRLVKLTRNYGQSATDVLKMLLQA